MEGIADIVIDAINKMGIEFRLLSHNPVRTMEECRTIAGIDAESTALFKNIFLCNRQKTAYYLLLLQADKRFCTSEASKALLSSRLSFGAEEDLMALLKTRPGSVSPAGLLFDTAGRVQLAIDNDILKKPYLAFHPCDCSKTIVMEKEAFISRFLPSAGHTPVFLSLPEIAERQSV